MHTAEQTVEHNMSDRIRRSQGRLARNAIASAKVTKDELREVAAAAKREGKALSEWAREALLREARGGYTDRAIFTELLALRLLMNGVLREVALGRTMTEKQYEAHIAEARKNKHQTARDVLAQYQPSSAGEQ